MRWQRNPPPGRAKHAGIERTAAETADCRRCYSTARADEIGLVAIALGTIAITGYTAALSSGYWISTVLGSSQTCWMLALYGVTLVRTLLRGGPERNVTLLGVCLVGLFWDAIGIFCAPVQID